MRSTLAKWLLRSVLALLLVVVLAALSVVIVMNTERGSRWALARIAAAVPGELQVDDPRGTLWRGMQFARVRYGNDKVLVDAHEPRLDVDWFASAIGRLSLDELHVRTLVIETEPSDDEPSGTLSVSPSPLGIDVEDATVGDLQIVRGESRTALRDVRLRNARYEGTDVRLRRLVLAYDELAISATRLSLGLTGDGPLRADVEWQLADRGWSGSGPLRGSLVAVRFEQVVSGPLPGNVAGSALLLGRDVPHIDATVRWERWTFAAAELVNGEATLSGFIDDYTITAARADVVADGRRINVAGSGTGHRAGLERFDATVQFAPTSGFNTVTTASGRVSWRPDLVATAEFSTTAELDGRPIDAGGRLDYTGNELRCSSCRVRSGPNSIDVEGTLAGDTATAQFVVDLPQLALLLPGYSGAVSGRATLQSSPDGPQLDFDLGGRELATESVPDYRIDVDAEGTARGAGEDVVVEFDDATVVEASLGRWQLAEAFNARWSDAALDIAPHSWSGDIGTVRLSALRYAADETVVAAAMDNVSLALFNPRLPANMRLAGVAHARADLRRNDAGWSGTLSWRQDGTTLTVTGVSDDVTTIRIPEAFSDLRFDDGGVVADAAVTIEPAASASLHVELERLARDAPLQAELELRGEDFTWMSAIVPYIDQVDGSVAAAITAQGSADAPEIRGTATWSDGRLLLPALNVPLDDINVTVSGASAGNLQIEGATRAGDGNLQLRGELEDVLAADRTFDLRVSGADAELVNWPEYRLWATPDLRLVGRGGNWRYTGSVTVPRAEVRLRELPTNAVTESPDVVVDGEDIEELGQIRWSGEARVELGDEVRFRALGLDTRLTGDLRVRAQPGRPIALNGSVSLVDGSFEAYGQELTIREGQLTFTGPVDDPLVDVRAVRVIDTFDGTVTAGLHVRGRAQDLTSTVFSEPAMADADALSYLVVGRPLNEATEAEGGDVSGAAVALGLKQATRITQQIGQSVGLDQLAVTGDGGETTALVAGKQINSRLYARYAYGVFSRVGALLLRYRLTPNLTLEAGAGETQSIDILYSIERD